MIKEQKSARRTAIAVFALLIVVVFALGMLDKPQGCADSDGVNRFTGGVVIDAQGASKDRCIDKLSLQEFSCDGEQLTIESVNCAYSCQAGRCVAPDLTVTAVFADSAPELDEPFDIVIHVKNIGNYPASPVDIQTYFEPGYGFLLVPPANTLAPGEVTQVRYRVTYKVPGTFRIQSVLDPYNLVEESNEDNEHVELITISE